MTIKGNKKQKKSKTSEKQLIKSDEDNDLHSTMTKSEKLSVKTLKRGCKEPEYERNFVKNPEGQVVYCFW